MGLNLVARKSLRDNEEFLNKSQEEIKTALNGEDWIIEFDWDVIFDQLEAHTQKSLGEIFYKNLCPQISKCILAAAKDELAKEALINANTNKKIEVRVNEDKKNTVYWKYEFNGGSLVLLFKPSVSNVNDAGHFQLYKVIPSEGVYTIPTRLNLKKNQEKCDLLFEKLKSITSRDWSFDEASLETVYVVFDTPSSKESFGDTFSSVLVHIVNNVEKRCKDDTTLEAFIEATANSRITFRHNPKLGTYWSWAFENGELVVTFKSISNISDNSHLDFIKVLPVPGVFTLVTRLDMKKAQEKFDTAFEKIKAVTKMDWSYDQQSLEDIYPKLEESNKSRLGETFSDIITYAANNIEKRCQEEITLEAFIEATANAKIVFRGPNPKLSSYWQWAFENGDLILNFKSISNISDNSHFDFTKVLPVPGVFTLVSRLNIKKAQEKIDAAFEKIKAVTKMDWSYDQQSLEDVYPKLEESNKSSIGETIADIFTYAATNIEKRSKDDITLEAFIEATANAKFVFRGPNPKLSSYWQWSFENGDLILNFKSIGNLSDNTHFDFTKVLPTPGVLSLVARLNMKEYQQKINDSLEKIKEVLKIDWSVEESSIEEIYPHLDDRNKASIGDNLNSIVKAISDNIVKRCKNDEMVLEAFTEATPKGKIVLRRVEKQTGYWVWSFEDGNLIVSFTQLANINDNSHFNFEKLL